MVKGGFVRRVIKVFAGIFVILATLSPILSQGSEWSPVTDFRVGLNGRTWPIGAQVVGTVGLGQQLWGPSEARDDAGKIQWRYGYARVAANAATSAVVNRIGAEILIYPVSILGLSAGYDIGTRNFTPRQIDCGPVECNGTITRKYLRLQFLAAAKGFALSLQGRYEELRGPGSQKPIFDEMTLLVGRRDGERVLTWTPALVYKLKPDWQVGGAALYSRALDTGGDSLLYGPVVGHEVRPELSVLVGVGLNRSPVVHSAITGFFMVQWMLKDGLSIMDRIASAGPAPTSRN